MHTPTPWHVGMRQADRIVYDATGWAIANATVYHAKGDGEPLENAKFIVEACNAHDTLVARVAELEAGLTRAIELLCQWHDDGSETKAYRFDLKDHPKIKPIYAALKGKG